MHVSIPVCGPEVVSESRDLTFGQYLRRERVLRGITKEEILRVTKVSPEYYEALENNHFHLLPPKAFVVGFLRVMSKYAGLDGDEVVNRFLGQYRDELEETTEILRRDGFFRRNLRRIFFFGGFACLLFLMFAPLLVHR